MRNKLFFLVASALLLAVIFTGIAKSAEPATKTVDFKESLDNFINPERGFYVMQPFETVGKILGLRQKGCSLIMMIMDIKDFKDSDISAAKLDELRNAFKNCRANGLKVIFRAAYGFTDQDYYKDPKDMNRILGHIKQLQPIFKENQDVLYVVQAGFFGPWGEWHGSNWGDPPGLDARKTVLFALLDAIPSPIAVQIRRPAFIRDIFQDEPGGSDLSDAEAYSGTKLSRTGWHNDALLSNASDMGTYAQPGWSRQMELDWSDNHCRYTPFGGETAALTKESLPDNAVYELAKLHASYINSGYHPEVIKRWKDTVYKDENTFKHIERRLGYCFVLEQAEISKEVAPGGILHLALKIKNKGFASPYLPRNVFLVLMNDKKTVLKAAIPDVDPRRWWPEEGTITIDRYFQIPGNIQSGYWNVALLLSDPAETLKDDGRYAIRLGNTDVDYSEPTGFNTFYRKLYIHSGAPGKRTKDNTFKVTLPQ